MATIIAVSPGGANEGATLLVSATDAPSLAHVSGKAAADLAVLRADSPTGAVKLSLDGSLVIYQERGSENLRDWAGALLRRDDLGESVIIDTELASVEEFAELAEGALLGAYRYNTYRSTPRTAPSSIAIVTSLDAQACAEALKRVEVMVQAQLWVRDLVNTPAADLRTVELAQAAEKLNAPAGVSVRIWGEDALRENNCGGLLGVGAGSTAPSQLVRLEWAGEGASKHVALVGKGITFDSGGMSLKTHDGLLEMKTDMTGAATIAAVVFAAARLNLPVKVTGWMCIAENMLSGSATRVGDVLHISDGTTVEVNNTDAEGRLVLADGISQARLENPDEIIDIATLTGAQIVALGPRCAGVMGSDDLAEAIVAAAEAEGEEMWKMPLPEYLADGLKSTIADLRNSGPRGGGMLVAGLFLKHFVKDSRWAHIDIAGPSFITGEPFGATPKGATGFAVRTLVHHLESLSE